ncbi:hypothetical protein C3941_16525 [Kaistia algarum]|uniref:hypothetical protein n=1 Tax=Kaistia algarum TaxID=2083279 RepID=UPI000CE8594E|nr:hypothetical protein [Kaistia algarum]MCX5514578.1 hypothetical protein [Kaistia algarum]PPE78977.1 hypothetical protein C3941_16525 [Kaistia algarum]
MKLTSDRQISKYRLVGVAMTAGVLGLLSWQAPASAQSTNQQIEQLNKDLNMNTTPDLGALGFQDDLATLEQCQSGCKPLIESMLKKYKTGANFGGNGKLGMGDVQQLAVAIGNAAATLPKAEADQIATTVASDLGPDAATAYQGSYTSTTAPYAPK